MAGAASDQLYSILLDTPPPDHDGPTSTPAEIGGVEPAEHARDPLDAGRRRRRDARRRRRKAAAVRTSRATTRRASTSRRNRGLQSITLDGYDRRTLLRVTGIGPGNNPPAADDIRLSPDGTRAFVSLQGKHYLVTVPRAGRETVEVRIQGRGDNTAVPVKRMSLEGGDYLEWTRRWQRRHLGVGRAVLPAAARRRRAAEDRHRRRAAARAAEGLGAADRRAHHHDEGRRGDRAAATCW